MNTKEIMEKIDALEWEIFREECKDLNYDSWKVWEWNQEIKKLKNMLNSK